MNQPTLGLKRTTPRVESIQRARQARKTTPRGKQPCTPQQLKEARRWVKDVMPPFPWTTGIQKDFMARKPPSLSEMGVRIALREVTSSDKYLASFEEEQHRHGFDGQTQDVYDAHRLVAIGQRLERKKEKS